MRWNPCLRACSIWESPSTDCRGVLLKPRLRSSNNWERKLFAMPKSARTLLSLSYVPNTMRCSLQLARRNQEKFPSLTLMLQELWEGWIFYEMWHLNKKWNWVKKSLLSGAAVLHTMSPERWFDKRNMTYREPQFVKKELKKCIWYVWNPSRKCPLIR